MNAEETIHEAICETQGEIYQLAMKLCYNKEEFSQKYLASKFCNREMDAVYSVFQLADAEECMDFIRKEFVPQISMMQYTENKTYWIGYMYRKVQIITKVSSLVLGEKIPYYTMARYYEGLHTIDDNTAVEIILQDNKLFGTES